MDKMQGNPTEIKEITFVDVDKGKISNFFKKRMEQKGLQVGAEPKKVIDLLGISSQKSPSISITKIDHSKSDDSEDAVKGMVAKMLEDYEEVLTAADLESIPTGTRLKYITYDPEKRIELFRQGGYLRSVKPHCVVLAGLYKNVYNKRYRVNRQVYDPRNKENLLYNTRFFVKRSDHPQPPWLTTCDQQEVAGSRHLHLDLHPQVDVMMGGSKEEEDIDHSEDLIQHQISSFQKMSERILGRKEEELNQLNQRMNQLRERDQRLERFRR